jgi:CDGSH-type Zn-finger protein
MAGKKDGKTGAKGSLSTKKDAKVKIIKDGPYFVSGGLPLAKERAIVGEEGEPEYWEKDKDFPLHENYTLCRCGQSKNKPFCDGTHVKNGFNGAETASMEKYDKQSERINGPKLILADAEKLCAVGRFCHLAGTTWANVEKSDDSKARKIAEQTACNCPSGRLVAYDRKTGKAIEPNFKPSISLIEDTYHKVSGPIWLKGGIELESADERIYETRNRCTICRCGKSSNKPFCNGAHIQAKFNDGDESLK